MTSITFSMAEFCKELNTMIEDKNIQYINNEYYLTKPYDEKYIVKEIDYHKINCSNFNSLLNQLQLLFDSVKLHRLYKLGDLTKIIFKFVDRDYTIQKSEHLYKITSYFYDNTLIEQEKKEHFGKEFNETLEKQAELFHHIYENPPLTSNDPLLRKNDFSCIIQ